MKNKKIIYLIIGIVILLIIDQITKIFIINKNFDLIPNFLGIQYEENISGSFGVGQKGTITFIVTNVVVLSVLIKFMKMQSEQIDKKTYIAFIMIIAGVFGNLIDRIFRGFVIRFIKIANLPTFNIADILIVVGWIMLAIFFAIFAYSIKKEK